MPLSYYIFPSELFVVKTDKEPSEEHLVFHFK